ncbi:MAG: sigma-54 dependent transcriptional regulator [Candidatus Wallbacteria bacterium]
MSTILVCDDKPVMVEFLSEYLQKEGHTVITANDGEAGYLKFRENQPEIVITDMKMPKVTGIELLQKIKSENSDTIVILMTAFATIESAIEAMREGAYDYIIKPFSLDQIKSIMAKVNEKITLVQENKYLKSQLQTIYKFDNLIGQSGKMREMYEIITKVIDTKATVMITGETGTGKELIARAIHFNGPRKDKSFIKINCAAIPEGLLESELFGHERGAFTGAINKKEGKFEIANGGTLFLDEIGEIPQSIQVKLLRVLQNREFERVGGNQTIKVDVRIIAATNRDLAKAVAENTFRNDLYYRLNVVPIAVPPLRDRITDIPLLVEHFTRRIIAENNKPDIKVSKDAMDALIKYKWPGNVRELENIIERVIILTQNNVISIADLPEHIVPKENQLLEELKVPSVGKYKMTEVVDYIEQKMLEDALKITNGQQTQAAEILGINRGSLIYKMKKFNLYN